MKIGFIGMGNMAQALCEGFVQTGVIERENIFAYAPHQDRLRENAGRIGFTAVDSLHALAAAADMLFVACKPYQIEDVLTDLGEDLRGKALVSVAAGWTMEKYELALARLSVAENRSEQAADSDVEPLIDAVRIQTIMPNTPAMVREGVFLVEAGNSLTEAERDYLFRLLKPLGLIHELPGHLLAIGSAVTGCSPAFVDLFIEAYADAAVKYGIPRADAYRLISQAVLGSAKLQLVTGEHPGVLKDKVCSPAGTTILGVQALEECGLRAACMASVDAVMNK
ncbi:MAG: pyrroline-5-carboxylate reductase [Lachnospiraceae bacterium]|nr:pyrroline-5-carboxylate reductase [Lachnospiraceae bacterium]